MTGHYNTIMSGIKSMLTEGIMCDVVIVAGGKEFDAHRLVLAAGSEFFKNRFSAHNPQTDTTMQKEKVILSFDFLLPETFALVLESLYTGRIKVTERMVSGALRLAAQLGILPLRRRLILYLCQIVRAENVEEIQSLGQELQSQELMDAASAVALRREVVSATTCTVGVTAVTSAADPKSTPLPCVSIPVDRSQSPVPSMGSNTGDDLLKACPVLRAGSVIPPGGEVSKCPWTKEEDKMVMELVRRHGLKSWSALAVHLPGRTGKQIREVLGNM